jgi:hypothetical protein
MERKEKLLPPNLPVSSSFFPLLFLFPFILLSRQGDIPLPSPQYEEEIPEKKGFLTRVTSRFVVGTYFFDSLKARYRWEGNGEGEILLYSGEGWHWEWNLSLLTLGDDQNEIYFRLIRLYYQAFTGIKIPGKKGIFTIGYQHRCSHGADEAVPGRILIRSSPVIRYRHNLLDKEIFSSKNLSFTVSLEPTLLGQNADPSSKPRLFSFFLLEGVTNSWKWGGGAGPLVVSHHPGETFSLFTPYKKIEWLPVYGAYLGALLPGRGESYHSSPMGKDLGYRNQSCPPSCRNYGNLLSPGTHVGSSRVVPYYEK